MSLKAQKLINFWDLNTLPVIFHCPLLILMSTREGSQGKLTLVSKRIPGFKAFLKKFSEMIGHGRKKHKLIMKLNKGRLRSIQFTCGIY